jgi:ATP-dependent Clp protease ATP-binding subunit ClpA
VIQTEIKDVLSDEILFGKLQNGGHVALDLADEKLTFNFG